jgi:hypothetical protein
MGDLHTVSTAMLIQIARQSYLKLTDRIVRAAVAGMAPAWCICNEADPCAPRISAGTRR